MHTTQSGQAGAQEADRVPIGLLGVGLMGAALAERFLGSGRSMVGFDIDTARLGVFQALGGHSAGHAAEVIARCELVFLSLPTSAEVSAVLDEVSSGLSARHVLIDTTTGSPRDAMEAARRVESRGAAYLDATVSGSSEQVRTRNAVVMAGGSEAAFAQCRELLEAFAHRVFHVGPAGDGSKMKLATNLVLGLNRAALAEGLAFASSLGLNLEQTLSILQESMAYSRIMDTKGHKMISGDFAPQARLSQHLKDVRLIFELGRELGLGLPLSQAHCTLLEQAEAAGWGGLDNSAIIKAYMSDRSMINPAVS